MVPLVFKVRAIFERVDSTVESDVPETCGEKGSVCWVCDTGSSTRVAAVFSWTAAVFEIIPFSTSEFISRINITILIL
ncbi:hypothetical protein DO021_03215 [Desulfobacter hydrogenophilus]|uniref:Uncharacterized protein n=1 Tax=Desulfobacter hydrogenophilus TaxID=2291 RepID=A0A328FFW7_9BACT|nr:hypothetical protein DO021_03215 [Desulfobacter hydrogenophilus]